MSVRVNRRGRITGFSLGTYAVLWMIKWGFVALVIAWPYLIKPVGAGITVGIMWDAMVGGAWYLAHRVKAARRR